RAIVTISTAIGTSGAVIPLLTGLNTWNTDQNFTGHAQSTANCSYPAGTFPCWYNDNKGVAIVQDSTARYGFTSIADLPQTGTYTFTGSTLTASVTVDLSWVGGQILLCPAACTPSNGTLYLITAYLSANTLTITGSPGTSGSFSYQANAFQTSQG